MQNITPKNDDERFMLAALDEARAAAERDDGVDILIHVDKPESLKVCQMHQFQSGKYGFLDPSLGSVTLREHSN